MQFQFLMGCFKEIVENACEYVKLYCTQNDTLASAELTAVGRGCSTPAVRAPCKLFLQVRNKIHFLFELSLFHQLVFCYKRTLIIKYLASQKAIRPNL